MNHWLSGRRGCLTLQSGCKPFSICTACTTGPAAPCRTPCGTSGSHRSSSPAQARLWGRSSPSPWLCQNSVVGKINLMSSSYQYYFKQAACIQFHLTFYIQHCIPIGNNGKGSSCLFHVHALIMWQERRQEFGFVSWEQCTPVTQSYFYLFIFSLPFILAATVPDTHQVGGGAGPGAGEAADGSPRGMSVARVCRQNNNC